MLMAILAILAALMAACSGTEATPASPGATGVSPIATPALNPTPTPTSAAIVPSGPSPTAPPSAAAGVSLQVQADWGELTELFSRMGLGLQTALQKVSIPSLDGSELATQDGAGDLSFALPPGAAYMVKANETDDENPVWGLNGVDVVYTVNDENWAATNVFTARQLFQFPGVSHGKYQSPVLAATEHVLVPSQAAIEAEVVDEKGYVEKDWLATRLEERVETGGQVKVESTNKSGGYQVVTPSADPLAGIRYEIFTAVTQTPIYQSNVGGWVPSIISWN